MFNQCIYYVFAHLGIKSCNHYIFNSVAKIGVSFGIANNSSIIFQKKSGKGNSVSREFVYPYNPNRDFLHAKICDSAIYTKYEMLKYSVY